MSPIELSWTAKKGEEFQNFHFDILTEPYYIVFASDILCFAIGVRYKIYF